MKEKQFFIIPCLPGMNEYTKAQRTSKYEGNAMKSQWQAVIRMYMRQYGIKPVTSDCVIIYYHYFEKDKRRDKDNISGFAHKVIQDALVEHGVISNDGWNQIFDYRDFFRVDTVTPRIEVCLYGVRKEDADYEQYCKNQCALDGSRND